MPTAKELYGIILHQLEMVEIDCNKFDCKENLEAGVRIRARLKKVKKKIDKMISETQCTSKAIKEKRGVKPFSKYYEEYKETGRWQKYAKKHKTNKLQDS